VRDEAVGRTGALVALLLLVGAHASLANPFIQFAGMLSTGSHVVAVDSATVLDEGGALTTYQTAGWGGDTGVVDTFTFVPLPDFPPMVVTLSLMQDDSAFQFAILAPDSWYTIPGAPRQARALFGIFLSGLEEDRCPLSGRAGLTVSPSIVRANTTIRAERVPGTSCAFVFYDAVGSRVRTLRTHVSWGAATATWNGEDDFGRRLPEGVYYCCLDRAPSSTGRKVLLTRR
jgi:hypothetical protein